MMSLQGKTALVTGGGAGIGQQIVWRLAAEGARVISVDWDAAANEETATGGLCVAVTGDVSKADDVRRAFDLAGPVDILVNNAASVHGDGFLHELPEGNWDKVVAICLKSVFLCSKAVLPSMMERRSGAIINISSVNGLVGIHFAAYSAAKGGIISLTRLLAAHYGGFGVRANTICPGTILSENSRLHYEERPELAADLLALYPGRKFGCPDDIASAVLFLASDQAAFLNGATIPVDGGLTAVRQLPTTTPQMESKKHENHGG
ncbi:MAG: SDR family NAD(P)-dependent oxidoreductase [Bryobacteraceae bacterium]